MAERKSEEGASPPKPPAQPTDGPQRPKPDNLAPVHGGRDYVEPRARPPRERRER